MKILFAISGMGNGHILRAKEIYPELCRHGDVDVMISGIHPDADLSFPVKHRLYGISPEPGGESGVNTLAAARMLRLPRLLRDANSIKIRQYDLVINDFEPITAWAAKLRDVPCISLSHQWAIAQAHTPKPEPGNWRGLAVLKGYAPCSDGYGFHFKSYSKKIFTPVIRREVRELIISDQGHVTVYLPAWNDDLLIPFFQHFADHRWVVFSRHCTEPSVQGNVYLQPIENKAFMKSMASSRAVMCGADFDTTAEALYLGKKLMVIPTEGQFEQQCNAVALASLSVPSIRKISLKYYDRLGFWLLGAATQVAVDYPDQTGKIVDTIMADFRHSYPKANHSEMKPSFT